jgi:hypothetical protein
MLGAAVPVAAANFKNVAATAAGSQQHRRSRRHPYLPRLRYHHPHRCPNGKSAAAQVSGIAQLEHVLQQLSSSTTLPLGHAAVRHRATLTLI